MGHSLWFVYNNYELLKTKLFDQFILIIYLIISHLIPLIFKKFNKYRHIKSYYKFNFIAKKIYINLIKMKILTSFLLIAILLQVGVEAKLVFSDNFDTLDFHKWKHDITLSGGGNWEFEIYDNNRSTSFVKNSKLNIKPVLTEDKIGANNVRNGYTYDMWGGSPADQCTANSFFGCSRTSNGFNIINPVMSAKLTTVNSFSLKYGRVEVKAKLPKGKWLWPAIWLLPRHQ
jgi:hypothetical protein